jgi:hypothetical protein
MLYLATVSFSGQITMTKGKIAEISDPSLVSDLLKAGYIIPYEATDKKDEKPVPKTKRKGKA